MKNKFVYKTAFAICITAFVAIYLLTFTVGNISKTKKDNERISIVTTVFAAYDFARQIAGENADITLLLRPGEESHTYEPTPSDISLINDCDLFIYGGGESENWVDSIISSTENEIKTVKMMDVAMLHQNKHHHEESEEHDHEEIYDEHVWTSPENAILICEAICDALTVTDNENTELYCINKNNYIDELKKLSREIEATVSNGKRDVIYIGDRFPMLYFCEEYGIEYKAAFPGCSAQVEANPTVISTLIKEIKSSKAEVVFKVDLSTGLVAETISEETGAKVQKLYSCHVVSADEFENGETYLSLMQKNLEAIKIALN